MKNYGTSSLGKNSLDSIFKLFISALSSLAQQNTLDLIRSLLSATTYHNVIKLAFLSQKAKYSFFFRSIHFFVYHHQLGTFTTPVENLGSTRPNFVSMPSKIGVATWKPPT